MNYSEAILHRQELENKNKVYSDALQVFGRTELGLTPDNVKSMPEFKKAKADYDKSFTELRNFNSWFIKTFKKEYAADRQRKRVR